MAIPARDDSFKRAKAPEGRSNCVCVDVWDPGQYKANGDPSDSPDGMVEKKNSATGTVERKYMVNVVFVVGDRQGNPLRDPETGWLVTVSQRFNNTLHERAHLRKFIEQWLNNKKRLSDDQIRRLSADLERPLLGRPGEVSIVHNGEYANIDWVEAVRHEDGRITPPEGYVPMQIPTDYVRVQDRAADRARREQQEGQQPRPGAAPPAHAPQHAGQNAFAQAGGDDPFGGPAAQPPTYDNFQAPPLEDDDDDILPF